MVCSWWSSQRISGPLLMFRVDAGRVLNRVWSFYTGVVYPGFTQIVLDIGMELTIHMYT